MLFRSVTPVLSSTGGTPLNTPADEEIVSGNVFPAEVETIKVGIPLTCTNPDEADTVATVASPALELITMV